MDHEVAEDGHILDGRYRIEGKIGEGGMGVVLAARHIGLGQRVAIKLMRADADPVWRRRFVREAKAASCIESDHVARVFDVGLTEGGAPFLAMEYLEGRDLAAVMHDDGPLAIEDAVVYAAQACRALDAAHRLGIVHRDVKPANLFLTTRDDGTACIKLLDFGISKQDAEVGSLTGTHAVLGSPQFMPPEQLASCRDVDARADVWSLGATLFELLTLEHVFEGQSLAELCTAIMRDAPRRLLAHRPDAPPELDWLIQCCLQKDVRQRVQSARELEAHLDALRELPPSLRPTLPAPAPARRATATLIMSDDELLDQTPVPSIRPVVSKPLTAESPRPRRASRLMVASFVGLLGFAIALEAPSPEPVVAAPEHVVLPEPTPAPPPPEVSAPPIEPVAAPPAAEPSSRMAASDFSNSGLINARHQQSIEADLLAARTALTEGSFAVARSHVTSALTRLQGVGVRPNEGVSSLGARASLLRGEIEGAELRSMLKEPIRRADAKTIVPKLERQLMKAQVAYQLVRGWGVPSFYRCAVVAGADLQLDVGQAFTNGWHRARTADEGSWMVKAAASWLRKAHRGFRTAVRVPAETTLCLDDAKRGLRETERASAVLPK